MDLILILLLVGGFLVKWYTDRKQAGDSNIFDGNFREVSGEEPDASGDGPQENEDPAGSRDAAKGPRAAFSGKKPKKKRNSGRRGSVKLPKLNLGGKKLGRVAALIVVLLAAAYAVKDCAYNVSEQENAVVTMFGNILRTDTAGLHFKLPLVQKVQMVDITTHGTGIGYDVMNDGQSFTSNTEGLMITKDFNFIDIDFYMEYKVSDPVAYLYNSSEPEEILKNIALASIRSTVINYNVDDAITTAKGQIQAEVKERMVKTLDEQNIGISVVNMTIQDATPPTDEIIAAFKSVETAKQGKETAINNASKYKNEQVPAAQAEADRITKTAEAQKEARIAEAEGQVARFNAIYEQYEQNPLITKQRLFYETMEDVLPDLKVIITDGTTQTMLPLDSFTSASAGTASAGTETASAGESSAAASVSAD